MAQNLKVTSLGGTSGLITLADQDAGGARKTAQNGPQRNLRILSFDGGPWTEGLCIAAERAAIQAAQTVLDGSNTLAGHVATLAANLTPAVLADVEAISTQIGQPITFESAVAVLGSILADHGAIPSSIAGMIPSAIKIVEGYLKKK